jgi:hypothetical protein
MLRTLRQINEEGWRALVEKLGYADALMYIMENEQGFGNYTEERKKMFKEKSLDEILREIEWMRKESGGKEEE